MYSDVSAPLAEERMEQQYGESLKRFIPICGWLRALKCLYYDYKGKTVAETLYLAGHPAQIHYGISAEGVNTFEGELRNTTSIAYASLGLEEGDRALHLGCGVGGCELQASQGYPGVAFDGVSVSPTQVKVAEELIKLRGVGERVKVLPRNYFELPEEWRGRYKGVIAIESLCYCPKDQLAEVLSGVFRILKPGGRLTSIDGFFGHVINSEEQRLYEVFLKGWDLPGLVSLSEFVKVAESVGFRVVRSEVLTPRIMAFARGLKWRALIGRLIFRFGAWSGSRYVRSLMGELDSAMAFADTGVEQYEAFAKGVVDYALVTLERPLE